MLHIMLTATEVSEGNSSKTFVYLLLALVLVFAAVVRLYGINFGLPYTHHPDEPTILQAVMAVAGGNPNPGFFHYPSLYIYFSAFTLGLLFIFGRLFGLFASMEAFKVAYWFDPTPIYITIRAVMAFIGTLAVYFTYKLGEKAKSREVGLAAAAFLAGSFLHIRVSHYAITDVPTGLMVLIAHIFIVDIYRGGKSRSYILAGIFCGLAASTKYNGAIVAIPIFAAHILHLWENGGLNFRNIISANLLKAAGASIGAFLITSPFVLLDFNQFWADFSFETQHMQKGHTGFMTEIIGYPAWLFHLRYSLYYGMGGAVLAGFIVSFVKAFVTRDRLNIILFIFPLVYLVIVGSWSITWDRYLMPILPFICYGAADALFLVVSFVKKQTWKYVVASILIIAALIQPVSWAVEYDRLLTAGDTRTQASEWIKENIEPNTIIATDWYCIQLPESRQMVEETLDDLRSKGWYVPRRLRYLEDNPVMLEGGYRVVKTTMHPFYAPDFYKNDYDFNDLIEKGVQYAAINTFNAAVAFSEEKIYPERAGFYWRLRNDAELVKKFTPYDDRNMAWRFIENGVIVYLPYYPLTDFAGGIERMGTEVEIYRLSPEPAE
ncbi:MAG: phospholipid carrier-dependent glycosyltransferase [candidate division Zixibacteria bacterium]|nr:phospholipid carrier-dependent glycosyltransferase [candidate division Zixibacteria bacterium]